MSSIATAHHGESAFPHTQNLSVILQPVAKDLAAARDSYHQMLLNSDEDVFVESLLTNPEFTEDKLKVKMVERIAHHLMGNDGKWIRAAIVMLTAGMKRIRTEAVQQVAIAVELLHLATLVHDDIIDQAPMRRGAESVPMRWGNSVAVLMGDLLFAKAFQLLLISRCTESQFHLMQATNQMCLGEIKQLTDADPLDTTEQGYLQMIEYKTASLMGAAAGSGASLAGMDAQSVTRMKTYGHSLGMAFQIVDDILDYTSSVGVMGKEQGGDLRNGKVTLPLIHLIRINAPGVEAIFNSEAPDQEKTDALLAMMREAGSIEYAYAEARNFADKAVENLHAVETVVGSSDSSASLSNLVNFILQRDH
ncbi:MAG: polyprenyl synthetase family protein [bacterium]|jgi:geranylgeranyl pyrophosphate synthase|nr:polyprenyl synthetase family protein [bacterium]